MSFLMNVAYCLLLAAVSPVLVYRSLAHGKYRDGWGEKLFGSLPDLREAPLGQDRYWFHAVSVGEVLLLQSIIPELRSRLPQAEIVLTTTTTRKMSYFDYAEHPTGLYAILTNFANPLRSLHRPLQWLAHI